MKKNPVLKLNYIKLLSTSYFLGLFFLSFFSSFFLSFLLLIFSYPNSKNRAKCKNRGSGAKW